MAQLMIVDDESDILEFAANFFRKRNIAVLTAASGEAALSLLTHTRPDLVLLDIKMNGIDGVETLRRMKGLDKNIKVIMVTGRKPEEDDTFDSCRELGALDYIHKPLQLHELEKIVFKTILNVRQETAE